MCREYTSSSRMRQEHTIFAAGILQAVVQRLAACWTSDIYRSTRWAGSAVHAGGMRSRKRVRGRRLRAGECVVDIVDADAFVRAGVVDIDAQLAVRCWDAPPRAFVRAQLDVELFDKAMRAGRCAAQTPIARSARDGGLAAAAVHGAEPVGERAQGTAAAACAP